MAVTAVLLPVLAGTPALADDKDDGKSGRNQPPARMSVVGGKRLGMSGTQVELRKGAPGLPGKLTGKSWLVADAESGDVLASHNAHWRLPPASTLKMLFADTVLPKLPKDREHEVEPSDLEGMGEGSSLVGIKEHQKYTVHDMWLGVFLRSGNDAVHVLSAMNGGVEKTVRDMQRHARDLHADDTHVVSPDGYDEEGQVSSAYDLTLFARSGLQKADFREYCSTVRAQFPGEEKKGKKKRETFEIQNTNRLLTGDYGLNPYKGMAGVKNGYTSKAGSTFTGVAQRGDRVLLVTVMNPESEEHNAVYKESAALLDWGFDAAGKVEPVGRLIAPRAVPQARADSAKGEGKNRQEQPKQATAAAGPESDKGPSGALVALGVTGGALAVLAAAAFLVHRHWPLPDLIRRR
ncbi:D-alanyl-D-alanine carboxypeptidase family protein [Streptomyces meridianus]|uniref:D-alanyl-D-alanine carboxypeptidase n=1 Tax=Streptomyces meridianus TaxID=2938945 RepID=A0ABT0X5X8_9ACTN|nr:D-alanyl-D-alanine carboxypeptidase [Streptomyces meridianus]MCM2577947.1 D-alanyl-D-alanine carboxypeptidase [Streptomyces meridianus]